MHNVLIFILGFIVFSVVCIGTLLFTSYAFEGKKKRIFITIIIGMIYALATQIFKYLAISSLYLKLSTYYLLLVIVPFIAIRYLYEETWERSITITLIWHISNILLIFLVNQIILLILYL